MFLALLNLGPSEVALLLVLFLVLFGADRVPALARAVGKARGEFERAQREVRRSMMPERERVLEDQLAFEQVREHQMAAQSEPERLALRRAAADLGVEAGGLSDEEVRAALLARLGAVPDGQADRPQGASAGGKRPQENAANAQQSPYPRHPGRPGTP